jgi:predicted metal-dependent HD superfamily phosphohydrolase
MENLIISEVKKYVEDLFKEKYDNRSTYHSLDHTREVAEAAEKIGKASKLNEEELEAVIIAGWFHDTGYLVDLSDHESHSARVAEEFLRAREYDEVKIKRVADCILATRMNHIPANLMEEVMHDADYINLANTDNFRQSELLRTETINYGGKEPTEEEWLSAELKFLLNHRYYTEYARTKLEEKKAENIKKIKKKLKKTRKDEAFILNTPTSEKKPDTDTDKAEKQKMDNEKSEKDKDKDKEGKDKQEKDDKEKAELKEKKEAEKKEILTVKGFETIYRLTATNHMRLNAIADRKANIMLTLNGIVISITLSIVASGSGSSPRFIIPTSLLIIVCLITIVFATLATRPFVTTGTISKEAVENKQANLLFFGNFSRMDYQDFDWGIRRVMQDRDYLHNAMIQDFYNLGKVLDMKFKYLRICYNVFMYGIILSVLSIAVLIALGY